jgi:hypothetical protein
MGKKETFHSINDLIFAEEKIKNSKRIITETYNLIPEKRLLILSLKNLHQALLILKPKTKKEIKIFQEKLTQEQKEILEEIKKLMLATKNNIIEFKRENKVVFLSKNLNTRILTKSKVEQYLKTTQEILKIRQKMCFQELKK